MSRSRALPYVLAVCVALSATAVQGVEVYPGPGGGKYQSSRFAVEVRANGAWLSSYTYEFARKSVTTFRTAGDDYPSVSFTTFGCDGDVTVRVRKLSGAIASVGASPQAKHFTPVIANGAVTLTLRPNDKAWLVIDGDEGNPLFIFADPPKPRVPQGATYFGPGVHEIGLRRKVADGEVIYLDGGAWVIGTFDLRDTRDARITGPGVLSGERWTSESVAHELDQKQYAMILGSWNPFAWNDRVEGITIVAAPFYNFNAGPDYIGGVKLISPWYWSTDGFQMIPRDPHRTAIIEHCFAFVGDDVFFPREDYFGDIEVRDCFVSTTNNSVFQLCYWGGPLDHQYHAYLHDIDIKNYLPRWNCAVFRASINNAPTTGVKNVTFENIRIEGDLVCPLIQIENREYFWPEQTTHPETKLGNTANIVFRNVTATIPEYGRIHVRSSLLGLDAKNGHRHYVFDNVRINGVTLTADNFAEYVGTNEFVTDLEFAPPPRQPPPVSAPPAAH